MAINEVIKDATNGKKKCTFTPRLKKNLRTLISEIYMYKKKHYQD